MTDANQALQATAAMIDGVSMMILGNKMTVEQHPNLHPEIVLQLEANSHALDAMMSTLRQFILRTVEHEEQIDKLSQLIDKYQQ